MMAIKGYTLKVPLLATTQASLDQDCEHLPFRLVRDGWQNSRKQAVGLLPSTVNHKGTQARTSAQPETMTGQK
jgi:hypothetical protein